jgi:hypothetical protein
MDSCFLPATSVALAPQTERDTGAFRMQILLPFGAIRQVEKSEARERRSGRAISGTGGQAGGNVQKDKSGSSRTEQPEFELRGLCRYLADVLNAITFTMPPDCVQAAGIAAGAAAQ